jgi:hypothetical protein
LGARHHAIFSSLLIFHSVSVQIFSSTFCFQTPSQLTEDFLPSICHRQFFFQEIDVEGCSCVAQIRSARVKIINEVKEDTKKIHLPKTEKRFSANVYLLIVKVIGGSAGHSSRAV